jgi:FemAB-related protein (PEP-CTERM system-associated)
LRIVELYFGRSNMNKSSNWVIEQDCTDRRQWERYVADNPEATNYHRYGWREVIEKSFGHRCYYLNARDAKGNILGLLPLVYVRSKIFGRFLISQPFFNYGGLLCKQTEIGDALLAEAANLRVSLDAAFVELRHTSPWGHILPTKQSKVAMLLDLLPSIEKQWGAFNPKLRNQIRKAEKSGLTAVVGGRELVEGFYKVFVRNMRDLGTPVYAQEFFLQICDIFPEDTRIITVYQGETVIAAGLINRFNSTVEMPWASSNRDYNSLCPNNLLYWRALQWSIEQQAALFDFGRSTPGEGTYKFKEQWGAKPVQLSWQYVLPEGAVMPQLNVKNPKYEMAIKMWRKLPLAVTRLLGPTIVKSIP